LPRLIYAPPVHEDPSLVIGVDAGGTGTRAVAMSSQGVLVGRGVGGPGNPTSHDMPVAIASIVAAVRGALTGLEPSRVAQVLIAMAGGMASRAAQTRGAFVTALAGVGIQGGVDIRPDVEAAFADGTDRPDGYVLVAGTGATACEIVDRRLVRHVDGNGWLLGDDGGGFWLGQQAMRAALAALQGRGKPTVLVERIAAECGVEPAYEALVSAAYARPPIFLSRLAPIVTASHLEGDAAAGRIVEAAVEALSATVSGLAPRPESPVVLAGSVVADGSVIGRLVGERAAARWSLAVSHAANPAMGAARLAAREVWL